MSKVKLNYANCLKEFVGKNGLSLSEISAFNKSALKARKNIEADKASGKIGFMDLPYKTADAKAIKTLAGKLAKKFDNFVVIGIGGSALGNIALQQALNHPFWNLLDKKGRKNWPKIFVPDNVDPDLISGILDAVDPKTTLFNVISKSGSTAECFANYFVFKEVLKKRLGKNYKNNLIVTTDAKKGYLRETVIKEGLISFPIPDNVGGRFSVMTPVGLVSAAFSGIDIEELLAGAAAMDKQCQNKDILKNPAALYAAIQYSFYNRGRNLSVMMPYSNALYGIADWYRQLWAESLGKKLDKNGKVVCVGPTPVKALGTTDQHSQVQLYIEGPQDKIITFLSVGKFNNTVKIPSFDAHYLGGHSLNGLLKAEEEATRLALTKEARPNMSIELPEINAYTVGQVLYMLELATAYAGEFFNIDTFNQPGVELGKELTYTLMGRAGFEGKKKELEAALNKARSGKYSV